MKHNLLAVILMVSLTPVFAQNRIGLELGAGKPTFAYGTYSSVNVPIYNTHIVLTGNAYYMRKVARHWYVGANATFEQYSFDYGRTWSDSAGGTYGSNVLHKSSYLNIGPVIDLGIGRYREYLHAYVNACMGFLLTGDQETRTYHETYNIGKPGFDNTTKNGAKINSAIFRLGFGLKQQFPLAKNWYATINESYSFMPFSDLCGSNITPGVYLHPGYLALQFGVMHKVRDSKWRPKNN